MAPHLCRQDLAVVSRSPANQSCLIKEEHFDRRSSHTLVVDGYAVGADKRRERLEVQVRKQRKRLRPVGCNRGFAAKDSGRFLGDGGDAGSDRFLAPGMSAACSCVRAFVNTDGKGPP